MIPRQLCDEKFRFVLIANNSKIPIEKDWQNTKNYSFEDLTLKEHIKNGGNYGILTGRGNLIVLDFDTIDAWEEWKDKLPKTFAIKTATKQLPHLYYYSETQENFPVKDKNGKTLLDIKGIGGQVVAPGSKINGREYEIYKDMEITGLPLEKLEELKQRRTNKYNLKSTLEGVQEGSRNDELFRLACSLREKKVTKNDALALMDAANNKSSTKLSVTELVTIRDSAYKYKKRENEQITKKPEIIMNIEKGKKNIATEQLSEEIRKKYIIYTTRDDERSECWIYEEGIFKPEARTYIKEYVRQTTKEQYTPEIVNKVIAKIEADTYVEQDDFFSRQNKYPYLIPCENGVLNIDTRELLSHRAEYCFFNKLPVIYDEKAFAQNIIRFIESVIPEKKDIDTLQEFYGSCLLKEYRYEKCLLAIGFGSNGKSKTLELLKYLLGIENCAEINPQSIEDDIFAKGELVNKMANISGDISSKALQNTGDFKDLTGRGLIMAARKFKPRVKFTNYAKFIFSANEVPITYDLSDGFFRRWLVIDFPFRFLDPEDIEEVPKEERENVKIKDPEIITKLTNPEELSGFLNWCLEGYQRLRENKKFSNGQTINLVRKMWIRKSSSIQAFLLDCVEEDYESTIYKIDFKQKYIGYCRRHKIKILGDKAVKTALTKEYAVQEVRPWANGETRPEAWQGIKFKNNFGVE